MLQVFARLCLQVAFEQLGQNVGQRDGLGVLGRVATDLTKSPGRGGLQVVLLLLAERDGQLCHALGYDDRHGEILGVCADIAEHHHAWQANVALVLTDKVNNGRQTASVHQQLCQLFHWLVGFKFKQ